MTTRLVAALILTTGATAFAAGDHWTPDEARHQARHLARQVHEAVHDGLHEALHDSLHDARHEVRAAIREAVDEARDVVRELLGDGHEATGAWQHDRGQRRERARARQRVGGNREATRDARDREREARAFRQVAITDDPCERRQGNSDRGHACEARDTRMGAPGSPLTVDAAPNGGIRVEGWDQADIMVRAVVQTWADSDGEARDLLSQVRVNAAGSQVTAEGPDRDGERNRGWSVSYRIWAPRQVALDLTARNGGVSIVGMRGESRFTTTNGGVTLDDVAGRVVGRTANGGVNVRLSGAQWDGAGLEVETTNGGVTLAVPRDYSAALEVSTHNGRLRSDFPVLLSDSRSRDVKTTLGSGGPLIKVRTVNGGVRLSSR